MTREYFIHILDKKRYPYEIEGDKIVITEDGDVYLNTIENTIENYEKLDTIPPGVVFMNNGDVFLESLTSLPSGVVFMNNGNVFLRLLETLPPGVVFNNREDISLWALIDDGLEDWYEDWTGSIEGIDSKRLFNLMIKQGVFER